MSPGLTDLRDSGVSSLIRKRVQFGDDVETFVWFWVWGINFLC